MAWTCNEAGGRRDFEDCVARAGSGKKEQGKAKAENERRSQAGCGSSWSKRWRVGEARTMV